MSSPGPESDSPEGSATDDGSDTEDAKSVSSTKDVPAEKAKPMSSKAKTRAQGLGYRPLLLGVGDIDLKKKTVGPIWGRQVTEDEEKALAESLEKTLGFGLNDGTEEDLLYLREVIGNETRDLIRAVQREIFNIQAGKHGPSGKRPISKPKRSRGRRPFEKTKSGPRHFSISDAQDE